jgi:hypothetical protein
VKGEDNGKRKRVKMEIIKWFESIIKSDVLLKSNVEDLRTD